MDANTSAQLLPVLIPILILAMVLRRNLRVRALKMERLWVYPAILLVLAVLPMTNEPIPSVLALGGFVVALGVGGAVGWWRGRLTKITVDPATHALSSQASIAGTILIGVIFAARYAVRMAMTDGGSALPAGLRPDAAAITQGLMLLAVAMLSAQRLEMFLRCRKLLAEARAGMAA